MAKANEADCKDKTNILDLVNTEITGLSAQDRSMASEMRSKPTVLLTKDLDLDSIKSPIAKLLKEKGARLDRNSTKKIRDMTILDLELMKV